MEAYHHIGPHRDTFQLSNPAARSHVVDNEGGPWSLLRMPGNTDLDESPDLPFLPGLEREQRADLLAFCVFPYTLVATTGTLATWYQLVPHAHDRMTLRIHILLDADVAADPATDAALGHLVEGVTWIHGEDIPVNEGPWRGLHSPLATQGRLSPLRGRDLAVQPTLARSGHLTDAERHPSVPRSHPPRGPNSALSVEPQGAAVHERGRRSRPPVASAG